MNNLYSIIIVSRYRHRHNVTCSGLFAVFIEEKGPECIESKESSLKKCTLITEGTHLGMENDDSFSYETNPYKKQFKAIFNSQKCK